MGAVPALALGDAYDLEPVRCRYIHPLFISIRILRRMAVRALLMRLFLIVALLANGSGIAGASVHVEHMSDSRGGDPSMSTAQTTAEAMTACHEALAAAPLDDEDHGSQVTVNAGEGSPSEDCCEASNCCACMHHCAAAIHAPALADFALRYRKTTESFLSGHPSAVLTNLFRPPIG